MRVPEEKRSVVSREENMGKAEQLRAPICDEINVAMMVIAYPSGELLCVNQQVSKDLEMSRHDLIGLNYKDFFWPEFYHVYEELAEKCQDGEDHTTVYYWSEKVIWEQISAKLISWSENCLSEIYPEAKQLIDTLESEQNVAHNKKDASTEPNSENHEPVQAVLLSITNITDVAKEQSKYEKAAYFDSVTGLPNGKKLELDIAELESVNEASFLYFQITNFDDIIDLYGWDVGDQIQMLMRDWLLSTECERAQYYIGDRGFIALGKGVTKEATVARVEQILERFKYPWIVSLEGTEISLYCKIRTGAVFGEFVRKDIRALLRRMTKAHAQQGEKYVVYDEEEDRRVKARHKLNNDLVNAILKDMDGFSVVYQPIVEAKTGGWVGLEALCRWQDSSGNVVSPDKFIPAVEKLGFISELDGWVRKEAMQQYRKLGLAEKNVFLDLNFSPSQPINDSFIKSLLEDINQEDFPINNLIMEITEGEKMIFDEVNLSGLETLKRAGVTMSLDDFGTGYSSIENLIKIGAATLKTDKILIDDLVEKANRQYLIRILIDLAHHLDMNIIVEGVEHRKQHELLSEYGADYIQGFYFCKPLTPEELLSQRDNFVGGSFLLR